MGTGLDDAEYARLRHSMVQDQLRTRHIESEQVLRAMEKIPRHLFVPAAHRHSAYSDGPLPIERGQTISQPYIVARMTELLRLTPTDHVLEIGTGSGYQTAVLAELAEWVWTIERHVELARHAEELLHELGYRNVTVIEGDGTLGFPDAAPYDAIIVTAAAPHVPTHLREQLKPNSRMVIPVSVGYNQDLRLLERLPDEPQSPTGAEQLRFRETSILGCTFVPLIGEEGYQR